MILSLNYYYLYVGTYLSHDQAYLGELPVCRMYLDERKNRDFSDENYGLI